MGNVIILQQYTLIRVISHALVRKYSLFPSWSVSLGSLPSYLLKKDNNSSMAIEYYGNNPTFCDQRRKGGGRHTLESTIFLRGEPEG